MQFSPEPVDEAKVQSIADDFKGYIDDDVEDILIHSEAVQEVWERLTNDEMLWVKERLGEKAPGSRKKYRSILNDLLGHQYGS